MRGFIKVSVYILAVLAISAIVFFGYVYLFLFDWFIIDPPPYFVKWIPPIVIVFCLLLGFIFGLIAKLFLAKDKDKK